MVLDLLYTLESVNRAIGQIRTKESSSFLKCFNLFIDQFNKPVQSQEAKTIQIHMELADRAVGFLLSFISLSIFTYYTFWVIILPFVDGDHFVHKYFLPQEYAILIPVSAGVALLCLLCIFIGFVMLKSKKKKA
ncbi:hypothetical protein TSUD_188610 [Trifolium subterraneum]|uniref:Dolichol phosphate-mannose biosynthesis regulatory protein n=2 Tax=IRL clade TaxID=2233839 RepID=A0A2Z6PFU3_TRISU|nr:hypothetical protein TSUD_188610 [Trifolium subterraneum]